MWHGPMHMPELAMHPFSFGWWMLIIMGAGIVALITIIVTRNMAGSSPNAPNEGPPEQ